MRWCLLLVSAALGFQRPEFRLRSTTRRADSETAVTSGGFNTAGEPPIEIRGFSLAKATLGVGTLITAASFTEYFGSQGAAGLSSIGFIYGIPILLIGLALQYAELKPVTVEYDGDQESLEAAWELWATPTLQKVRNDVTRHRYGDEAHLDTTVKSLGLVVPGKPYPQLRYLQLAAPEGNLAFSMIFSSPDTPFYDWADESKIPKYETFFGPNVQASVVKVDPEKRLVAIRLVIGDAAAAAAAKSAAE